MVFKDTFPNKSSSSKVYDKDFVRTDSRNQKIDKFLSTTSESISSSFNQEESFNESINDSRIGSFDDPPVTSVQADKSYNFPASNILEEEIGRSSNEPLRPSLDDDEIPPKKLRSKSDYYSGSKEPVANKMQLPNVIAPKSFASAASISTKEPEIIEHSKTICTPTLQIPRLALVNKGYIHNNNFKLYFLIFHFVK